MESIVNKILDQEAIYHQKIAAIARIIDGFLIISRKRALRKIYNLNAYFCAKCAYLVIFV